MQQQVGRYKILRQLGKGAMGVVYLADDPLLSRQVAIKTIDLAIEDATRREFLRGRLLRDARAAVSLFTPTSSAFTTWWKTPVARAS
jgi:serine/threonine-protein kinase